MNRQKGIRNWQDGKRIEAYCTNCHYSQDDMLALREIHRLHLDQADGSLSGTLEEALKTLARAPESQRRMFGAMGQKTDPRLCDALFRLADNSAYAKRILSLYKSEVKSNLNL